MGRKVFGLCADIKFRPLTPQAISILHTNQNWILVPTIEVACSETNKLIDFSRREIMNRQRGEFIGVEFETRTPFLKLVSIVELVTSRYVSGIGSNKQTANLMLDKLLIVSCPEFASTGCTGGRTNSVVIEIVLFALWNWPSPPR